MGVSVQVIIELSVNFSDKEKNQLSAHNDIDIKLYIQSEKLLFIGTTDGKEITEIITNPNRLVGVGGLYLLELRDEPNEWYMGEKSNDNAYRFWANYGDLENALTSL